MKNKILATVMAAVLGVALQASAVGITGKVDMGGTVLLNNTSLGSATATTGWIAANVIPTPTGSFVGTAGAPVTFSNFSWNPSAPSPPAPPVVPLWTFVSGAWTYTFNLANFTGITQNSTFLNLTGLGTLSITGLGSPYETTPGEWSFTITAVPGSQGSQNFDFGFVSSTAAVPDGGLTMALLGFALVGVEGLRRKLTK